MSDKRFILFAPFCCLNFLSQSLHASSYRINGDTLILSDSLIQGDVPPDLIVVEIGSDSLATCISSEKFRCIRIGKHFIKNPLFSLFNTTKKNKTTAILLAVFAGPMGVHRLYLGTKPIVPIVYAVTLGGGFFILPFTDIVVLLFTKDITKFENNDKIIMWLND